MYQNVSHLTLRDSLSGKTRIAEAVTEKISPVQEKIAYATTGAIGCNFHPLYEVSWRGCGWLFRHGSDSVHLNKPMCIVSPLIGYFSSKMISTEIYCMVSHQ